MIGRVCIVTEPRRFIEFVDEYLHRVARDKPETANFARWNVSITRTARFAIRSIEFLSNAREKSQTIDRLRFVSRVGFDEAPRGIRRKVFESSGGEDVAGTGADRSRSNVEEWLLDRVAARSSSAIDTKWQSGRAASNGLRHANAQ